jgi:hypothetical protein
VRLRLVQLGLGLLFAPGQAQHDQHAYDQDHERTDPQQRGAGLERRTVQHEVAIARDHIGDNLLVALALHDHLVGLLAQVLGKLGIGIGQILVLTDQAAQLGDELVVTRLLLGRVEGVDFDDRAGDTVEQQQHDECQSPHAGDPRSSRTSGMIFWANACSVIGPMCL